MSKDHDNRLSDLYRQSSQETPPAHIDRAVLGMARKSVRRRVFSPFGNHWVAGGAMLGVVMLSVLLIVTMPQQPDSPAPARSLVAPSSEAVTGARKEAARLDAVPADLLRGTAQQPEAPAAPKAQFDFYTTLPEMEVVVPEEEDRALMKQAPATEKSTRSAATAPEEGASYLQVGSFPEQRRAVEFRDKLLELGFRCEIQAVRTTDTEVYHRVRVGPFTDPETLHTARDRLDELGIATRTVTVPE
jgi:cell division protein FtsN